MNSLVDQSVATLEALVAPDDLAFLASCRAELADTWAKQQVFRTETEMRISVLNDLHHPTRAAKYWQAVREQAVFFEQLVMLGFEYRRNGVKIARVEARLADTSLDRFDREEAEIDLEELRYGRVNMERIAADRVRELRLWSEIKAELDDGSFDAANPNTHQLDSYVERFKAQTGHLQFASMPEAHNLLGQLQTALRVQAER